MTKESYFPQKRGKREMSRRKFLENVLKGVGVGAVGAFGLVLLIKLLKERKKTRSLEVEKVVYTLEDVIKENFDGKIPDIVQKFITELDQSLKAKEQNENKNKKNLEELENYLKPLKESEFSPPIVNYFTNKSPEEILDELWNIKSEKVVNQNKEKIVSEIKENLINAYTKQNKGYFNSQKDFCDYLLDCVNYTLLTIEWNKLRESERYKKNSEIFEYLKDIFSENFSLNLAFTLNGIILNEISSASSEDYLMNVKTLNYLLGKHGLRFIAGVPAVYDKLVSFGPFQLTELVLKYKDDDKFYPVNFMNEFVREERKIPKYIQELIEPRQHFQAEILLLIFALCELFKRLSETLPEERLKKLMEKKYWFSLQLMYYLAGYHHSPIHIKNLFLNFLNKILSQESLSENLQDFVDFISENKSKKQESLQTYLERFKNNLSILESEIIPEYYNRYFPSFFHL